MDKVKAFWADKTNRISLLLTVGLLLYICHYENQPFLQYIPLFQIGIVILLFTSGFLILNRWKQVKRMGLGPKYIWIPLAVISGSAVLRILVQPGSRTIAAAFLMVSFFGLYLVARQYGEKALNFFMPVVIIGAVSIVIQAIVRNATGNSGLFNNYATAAEFLVFGWLVSPQKHQWWSAAIVVTGLFFTGAPEAVFYVAVIGLVILIRRDWSQKILLPIGVLGLVLIVSSFTGMTQTLYQRSYDMVDGTYVALTDDSLTPEERDAMLDETTDIRWLYTWRLQRPVAPLGYGLDLTNEIRTTNPDIHVPHFIGLLITDQLGPIAAIAWMGCMIIGIKKTKWKYGFLALILFGVFQPFVWTEMAPYMWAMAGAATTSLRSSYVFREAI